MRRPAMPPDRAACEFPSDLKVSNNCADSASESMFQTKPLPANCPTVPLLCPRAITVTPENPRAASTAVSGSPATATLASSPRSEARRDKARAILGRGPKSGCSPPRSNTIVSQPASSTRGENDCAQSSKAAWAADSWEQRARPQYHFGAGFDLQLGHARTHSRPPRVFIHRKNFLQRSFAFEHRQRLRPQLRLSAQQRLHGKSRNEDAGKRHGKTAVSFQPSALSLELSATKIILLVLSF